MQIAPDGISPILEAVDLMPLHIFLTLFGTGACLYVMQVTGHYQEARHDPRWIRELTRLTIMGLALTLLWQFIYSLDKGWQPWPPALATNALLDVLLVLRAITVNLLQRRERERSAIFDRGQWIAR